MPSHRSRLMDGVPRVVLTLDFVTGQVRADGEVACSCRRCTTPGDVVEDRLTDTPHAADSDVPPSLVDARLARILQESAHWPHGETSPAATDCPHARRPRAGDHRLEFRLRILYAAKAMLGIWGVCCVGLVPSHGYGPRLRGGSLRGWPLPWRNPKNEARHMLSRIWHRIC